MIPVSLQINLAPGDLKHAKLLLLHQLKTLEPQVEEIVLTVDTKPSKGRFAEGWLENKKQLDEFLQTLAVSVTKVKILKVDYSKQKKSEVANFFFGTNDIPDKDHRGGPFYAYFFGLYHCFNSLVFHLDSDMFLGGGSATWIKEAKALFEKIPNCFILSPLPGPPHPKETLQHQMIIERIDSFMFQLQGMSTRIFLLDKTVFKTKKLRLQKPGLKSQLKSIIEGNANAQLPEQIIESYMKEHNLKRIDFLGSGKGLWSLHPPYRSEGFYNNLPKLIERVEQGDLPESQQGFYDINDEVCNWTSARQRLKSNRLWKRVYTKVFHK